MIPSLARLPSSHPDDALERRATAAETDESIFSDRLAWAHPAPPAHVTGGGDPIPDATRRPLERKLNADFSDVRLHYDARANHLANKLDARAFTVGSDIFIAKSESPHNRHLLTHELTHTIQRRYTGARIQRSILVEGKPWFDLDEVRKRFGARGVEIYFKLQDDATPQLFPTAARLYEQIELMIMTSKLMSRHEATGSALSASVRDDGCCVYPDLQKDYQLDPTYWKKVSIDPPAFEMLPAKVPSEAIRAIFRPGADSLMECETTMVAIRYLTELERLGDDRFNAYFSGANAPLIGEYFSSPVAWSSHGEHPLYAGGQVDRELVTYDARDPTKHLLPGDHVYFKNDASYGKGLWVGEHAMYIGNKLFVGFGAAEVMDSYEITESHNGEEQTRMVTVQQFALTHDQMIAKLQSQLPDPSTPIPGLEDPSNKGKIRVRRPKPPVY